MEPLGSHSYVYLETPDADAPLIFRAPGDFRGTKGDRLTVGIPADRCHLFGEDSKGIGQSQNGNTVAPQGDI